MLEDSIIRAIAVPKHREIWRNIGLIAWILGVTPNILAIVFLHGSTAVLAVIVLCNAAFLIMNVGFCCATVPTLTRKKVFYLTCLIIAGTSTVVLSLFMKTPGPDSTYKILGFVGCGLHSFSCLAFLVLNILLNIRGPLDPMDRDSESVPDVPQHVSNSVVHVRYGGMRRGRHQGRLSTEQSLRVPHSASTTQTSPCHVWSAYLQEQARDDRHVSIRTISYRSVSSQRRESSISLLRRTSTVSSPYETGPCGCTCFYTPNNQNNNDQDEDLPPYSETATGNISLCPIHSVPPPPPYEAISSYASLCILLGLPKYSDITGLKTPAMSPLLKLDVGSIVSNNPAPPSTTWATTQTNHSSSTTASNAGPAALTHTLPFQTITEEGSEVIGFTQQIPDENVSPTSSSPSTTTNATTSEQTVCTSN